MEINRPVIKANAKEQIRSTHPSPILMFLVVFLASAAWAFISERLFDGGELYSIRDALLKFAISMPVEIALSILTIGFIKIAMHISRNEPISWSDLLSGFSCVGKYIVLVLCMLAFFTVYFLAIALIAMLSARSISEAFIMNPLAVAYLPIIIFLPFLLLMYFFRQVLFIMLDNPSFSAFDCIKASVSIMKGRKMELFMFDLSFIGWIILCVIPYVGWIARLFVMPYIYTAQANYYNALLGLEDMKTDQDGDIPPRAPYGEED
ncbi:DUF975 family protein [Clostridiaceae bacterium OttesenSCG-928-D20]|nr:DUF975 family protein [Clostridiaceae bacterium OttesenSCG-928-D20]